MKCPNCGDGLTVFGDMNMATVKCICRSLECFWKHPIEGEGETKDEAVNDFLRKANENKIPKSL